MRWLTNIYDPSLPDFRHHIYVKVGETRSAAEDRMRKWLEGKMIGEPVVPEGSTQTMEQLKAQNIVGVYAP